ncbi:MAG: hypothetical protein VX100_07240 [Pseudomonadota bacterium]|nr:hypothetical protein [Pseudomonadota bacterium]
MNQEQENQLFKSIGSIEATQQAILKEVTDLRAHVDDRIDKVEKRVDKVEEQVTNNRVKLAGYAGGGSLLMLLAVEAIKAGLK